jgi:hypothetical protein
MPSSSPAIDDSLYPVQEWGVSSGGGPNPGGPKLAATVYITPDDARDDRCIRLLIHRTLDPDGLPRCHWRVAAPSSTTIVVPRLGITDGEQ